MAAEGSLSDDSGVRLEEPASAVCYVVVRAVERSLAAVAEDPIAVEADPIDSAEGPIVDSEELRIAVADAGIGAAGRGSFVVRSGPGSPADPAGPATSAGRRILWPLLCPFPGAC